MQPPFVFDDVESQVIATAIHAGHELRPQVATRSALDDATRRREEDPFTDRLTDVGGSRVVVHRSRFEVDLNRPRARAVYRRPDDAWGLDLWREPLAERDVEESLTLYDDFYAAFTRRLDAAGASAPYVVLDLHSYNHRRDGADAPAAPDAGNPEVNVGTDSVDRTRWGPLVDDFITALRSQELRGRRLDVRENVRFRGGELSRWVNQQRGARGCALAIEFKKTFMDEWTGTPDDDHLEELRRALVATVPVLLAGLDSVPGAP